MNNSRYVNPLTDFGFKKNFGDAEVMKAFLTDLLELSSEIKEIKHLDKERLAETRIGRGVVFDLLCETVDGSRFIVEMQKRRQKHFAERMIFYLSREVASQRKSEDSERSEDWDYNILPVYGIFFLNFELPGFKSSTQRTIEFVVRETGEVLTDKVRAFTLELPSYDGRPDEECRTQIDYWLYNLANMETMKTDLKFKDKQPAFDRMQNLSELSEMSKDESDQYFMELDYYRTIRNAEAFEKEEKERIMQEAEEMKQEAEGMKQEAEEMKQKAEEMKQKAEEMKQKTLEQGLQQGKLQVARNMKQDGLDVMLIAKVTGLTMEEINRL